MLEGMGTAMLASCAAACCLSCMGSPAGQPSMLQQTFSLGSQPPILLMDTFSNSPVPIS